MMIDWRDSIQCSEGQEEESELVHITSSDMILYHAGSDQSRGS